MQHAGQAGQTVTHGLNPHAAVSQLLQAAQHPAEILALQHGYVQQLARQSCKSVSKDNTLHEHAHFQCTPMGASKACLRHAPCSVTSLSQ